MDGMMLGAYQVAINNTARYIRSARNYSDDGSGVALDGFTAATVLSVAFCKAKEEVLADILLVDGPPKRRTIDKEASR